MAVRLDKKDYDLLMKYEIELDHVFHLKNLYKGVHDFIVDGGFESADEGEPEQLYFEIINQAGLVNHYVWWRFVKTQHRYFRAFLKLDWQGILTDKAEVVINGQKRKTNKSDMTIKVEMYLQWDPKREIRDHWFLKYFEKYIRKKIYGKLESQVRDDTEGFCEGIRGFIKQFLQLVGRSNEQKLFNYENRGLGDIRE